MSYADLLDSWRLHLRAQRKSPETVKAYTEGVRQLLAWCAQAGVPPALDKPTVEGFTVALLDRGLAASTVVSRQLGVRRFSAWLAAEGEIDADLLVGITAPRIDTKVVEPLSEDQVRALVKACQGRDLRERRDEAIVRIMIETGMRAGEVVAMAVTDVNLHDGVVVIRRGKGGKGRIVGVGAQSLTALDRYLRVRRAHRLAETDTLWLGDRGKAFTYDALHKTMRSRGQAAGIEGLHPHLLRHTAAHRWLAAGGSEQGLMAVAGWTRPDMLIRYTKAQASNRAIDEARRLNLGDL